MKTQLRRPVALATLIVVVASALFLVLVISERGGEAASLRLAGVPDGYLQSQGVYLTEEGTDYSPKTSADQARKTAGNEFASVREIRLAHLKTDNGAKPVDQAVWVVSFDPEGFPLPGGPEGGPGAGTTTFFIMFVDAETGESMFALASSHSDSAGDDKSPAP